MRKIKLMALLLAALMIVTAFAGCAGVKKEELDALDVRVQALEDLLNGQQKDLEEIKNDLAGLDNKEVLDAIDSMKTDLENQIKDVNTRVDDFEDKADAPIAGVSAETKAEQQKALALIEVKRAEFTKAVDEYSAEDYTKISEALGTATGAVNAATTVDAVKAAMTALDSELAKYMTYAMRAYDYYCKLLGNVNADAADLVEEAKDFLKEVKAVFGTEKVEDFAGKVNNDTLDEAPEAYIAELYYLVSEGSKAAKDEYIDIYNAINDLCYLYTSKSGEKDIPYIDEDGDIAIAEDLKTVKAYTTEAEDLIEEIDAELGENFVYCGADDDDDCDCNYCSFGGEDGLYATYEKFVENATLLGGEKLAKLVTNADAIVAAEDTYKLIEEAVAAFGKATKLKAGKYGDVFYYYTGLENAQLLETVGANGKDVWAADEYEKVADLLADWTAEYELSEENVEAIIAAEMEDDDFYADYKCDAHLNGLLVKAFNDFKAIAEKIADINEVDAASIDMVLAYNEVEELFADYIVLQEESDDDELEDYAKVEITLDAANFKIIVAEADLFDDYADERLDAAFEDKDIDDFAEVNGLIDLYTFEADVDEIESRDEDDVYFDEDVDNRDEGAIYKFLTVTYDEIKEIANEINTQIADLVEKVEDKKLATNKDFVDLEGKYIPLTEAYTSGDVEISADEAIEEGYYVLYTDLYKKAVEKEAYFKNFKDEDADPVFVADAEDWTIEAFKHFYPEFESMIDTADFAAAQKTMADRMSTLFTDALAIVDLVEAVDYVRVNNTVFYEDVNGNGKYDADKDNVVDVDVEDEDFMFVSLNDKAAVDTAWAKYDAWTKLGGAVNMEKFANVVIDDEVIDDVYYMEPLADPNEVDDAIKFVRKLDSQIGKLEAMAANFVATVENVKKVDAATAFVVTLDNNTLKPDDSNSVRFFAWTKFTAATNNAARDNDGTYSIISSKSKTPWKVESYKTDCYNDQYGNPDLADNAMTKAALLAAVVSQYNTFVAANVEYLADTKNNYDDNKNDYYQYPAEYVAYAAFDKAAADYAKYDLLAAKGAIFASYASDTNEDIRSLRKQVNSAASLAELESILYAFGAEFAAEVDTVKAVGNNTIYDFDRLEALVPELQ